MAELKHFLHEYELTLNEADAVGGKDVECVVCTQPINKLIDAFYTCNTSATGGSSSSNCVGFFMHKTCSEFPSTFTHPMIPQYPLTLFPCKFSKKQEFYVCCICRSISRGFLYGSADGPNFIVCLKCVTSELKSLEDRNRCHPGHDHPLTLVQSPALFLCHACNTTATDVSYICTKCCFWIHKSCANAPITYQSKFHNEHPLVLAYSLPLVYHTLFLCGICGKSINPVYWVYYCANCRFFAHVKCASSTKMLRSCALFPEKMEHHLAGNQVNGISFVREFDELGFILCQSCRILGNGIFLSINKTTLFDIGCASLPRIIKHEGHRHPLNQLKYPDDDFCKACLFEYALRKEKIMYGCEKCGFYIHVWCALRPHMMKHRWDPHPLYLILFVKNVADHPHDFDCEFCSENIDPTTWFYHCNTCDLSFHIHCIDPYYLFSNMKLGATNICCDSHPHPHGLTLVLNKKKRRCSTCGEDATGVPVLECSPCKYVVHNHKCVK
ncbi:uncharacterized protein LOC141703489 [Apium graveolens]|uniref:uncharacterized protein LOC141703489 n=1 Tax=Apium graveolens TaxID=4045 RepID=UPI003D7BB3B8